MHLGEFAVHLLSISFFPILSANLARAQQARAPSFEFKMRAAL
ncbi:hypothetical protein RchiOBHm_Chr3g0483501 [Rosa chinensis]|uniref:Uncharacterized protein n=1 Tax=Rosa chinensis TaxID=74649 RepID=A0A2P6REJ1_ROSCH|nr:hypothetical protein RchiOBHm_Chr3g0483501 [Rosa chinensis]